MTTNKTIYTVIIGPGYKLHEPDKKCAGWDYICYTDQKIKSQNWKITPVDRVEYVSDRQLSRQYKILPPHINLDADDPGVSFYIDAKFKPVNNLDYYINKYLDGYDMCMLKHHRRDCIFSEAKFISKEKIDDWNNMSKQITTYTCQGMPSHFGLLAPGIMIYRNTFYVGCFMMRWYSEYIHGCERDMLSLMYTVFLHQNNIKINTMSFRKTYKRFKPS